MGDGFVFRLDVWVRSQGEPHLFSSPYSDNYDSTCAAGEHIATKYPEDIVMLHVSPKAFEL